MEVFIGGDPGNAGKRLPPAEEKYAALLEQSVIDASGTYCSEVWPSVCVSTIRPLRVKHPRSLKHSAASSRPDSWPHSHAIASMATQAVDLCLRRVLAMCCDCCCSIRNCNCSCCCNCSICCLYKSELSIRVAHHHMDIARHRAQVEYFAAAVQRSFGVNPFISIRRCFPADFTGNAGSKVT